MFTMRDPTDSGASPERGRHGQYATWVLGVVAALLIVGIEVAILAVPERSTAVPAAAPKQLP
jgi:hypothetical protein